MKRIIALVLILVLVPALIVPASADDVNTWSDLIENGLFNPNTFRSQYGYDCYFDDLTDMHYEAFQIYIRPLNSVSSIDASLNFGDNRPHLTSTYVGDGVYCLSYFGSFNTKDSTITVVTRPLSDFEVITCRARTAGNQVFSDLSVVGSVYQFKLDGTISTAVRSTTASAPNTLSLRWNNSDTAVSYDAYFYFYGVNTVDFLCLYFDCDVSSVDNVVTNANVPLDYSIQSQNIAGPYSRRKVTVQVDLRNFSPQDRTQPLVVRIEGSTRGGTNLIVLNSGWFGFVLPSNLSNFVWYAKILDKFTALKFSISSMSSFLGGKFDDIWNRVNLFNSNVAGYFSSLWSNINSSFITLFDKLDIIISGDTQGSNNFNQSVNQAQSDIDSANAVIDSVTKPAVSDINISMDNIVSPADMVLVGGLFNSVFQNSLLFNVFFMGLTLSLVGYVIFGKRG